MPHETPEQRAERQARLSAAMGAMRLQDKVERLERDAGQIKYARGIRKTLSSSVATPGSTTNRQEALTIRSMPRAATGPGILYMDSSSSDRTATTTSSDSAGVMRLRIVDASVLIFSLRTMHEWSKDASTCAIVPLEAINTLDLLKKGDSPVNLAARKATRWLEEKMRPAPATGGVAALQTPGILAQRQDQRATAAQMNARRAELSAANAVDDAAEASASTASQVGRESREEPPALAEDDMFSTRRAPIYLRELLSLCLYCRLKAPTELDFAVAVAYAPAHIQTNLLEDSGSCATSQTDSVSTYFSRIDGRATEAWLDAYDLPRELALTSKTWTGEKASSTGRFNPSQHFGGDLRHHRSKPVTGYEGQIHSRSASPRARAEHRHDADLQSPYGHIDQRSHVTPFTLTSSRMHDASASAPIIARPSNANADERSNAAPDAGSSSPHRLSSRPLAKTQSAAERMEAYLKSLE
ncbi:hypothetical protein BCV70DRAFT_98879 [Testicularia cyperi]|uniref:PIN domain-containing protein n=1 Tax=Testicularia cyperi TaxID=1882483 RepID=A0A317XRY2_9BASI|nr:hypothetical protein BCV70DRAFT_98879 [Testicularia cyperi]